MLRIGGPASGAGNTFTGPNVDFGFQSGQVINGSMGGPNVCPNVCRPFAMNDIGETQETRMVAVRGSSSGRGKRNMEKRPILLDRRFPLMLKIRCPEIFGKCRKACIPNSLKASPTKSRLSVIRCGRFWIALIFLRASAILLSLSTSLPPHSRVKTTR